MISAGLARVRVLVGHHGAREPGPQAFRERRDGEAGVEVADGAAPGLRLDDAGELAGASCRAFFGAVAACEGERSACGFAVSRREIALPGETLDFDLVLVECRLVSPSHRRQLWTARGAGAKGACYEGPVIARSIGLVSPLFALAASAAFASLASGGCATSTKDPFDPGAVPVLPTDSGTFAQDGGRPDPTGAGEVFGHSENTLYRVDTLTRSVTEVGVFDGCTYVADIALDESSTIYASTGSELFYIETNTARCTRIAAGTFPPSLSFVPAGTVEPDREALVGFYDSDYVKIDPKSGVVTKIGEIGSGLAASGDLVSAKGGKTFLTVRGGDKCTTNDCLVEIDPATGTLTKNWGSIGRTKVFGLAFWGGELYAFTNDGELLLITLANETIKSEVVPIANAPAKFWGAGSTTSAPVGPVR